MPLIRATMTGYAHVHTSYKWIKWYYPELARPIFPALHGIGNEAILTASNEHIQSLCILQTSARSPNLDLVLFSDKQSDKLHKCHVWPSSKPLASDMLGELHQSSTNAAWLQFPTMLAAMYICDEGHRFQANTNYVGRLCRFVKYLPLTLRAIVINRCDSRQAYGFSLHLRTDSS